ncbi:ClpC protein [Nostoc sp. NIES-4103]|nr:ClpC protein [Nostoc sp. NIES-4103]
MVKSQICIKFPGEDALISWLKPDYQEVIALAAKMSDRLGHNVVGTEHLLLGLILQETSIAAQALKSVGVTLEKTLAELENIRNLNANHRNFESSFTPNAKEVIEKTLVFYRDINKQMDQFIGSESILLAILGKQETIVQLTNYTNYTAVKILQNLGINFLELTTQILQLYMTKSDNEANLSDI